MKTKLPIALLLLVMAVASPASAFYGNPTSPIETPEQKAERLVHRLEEIREMDTKSLSRVEKRALRKEVKTIKKEMAQISGGVYISIGAILVILLLILLLA